LVGVAEDACFYGDDEKDEQKQEKQSEGYGKGKIVHPVSLLALLSGVGKSNNPCGGLYDKRAIYAVKYDGVV
jgi:hypothetical protein